MVVYDDCINVPIKFIHVLTDMVINAQDQNDDVGDLDELHEIRETVGALDDVRINRRVTSLSASRSTWNSRFALAA